jgi:hypothetical protein
VKYGLRRGVKCEITVFKNLQLWSMDQQKPPRPLLWQAARILSYSTKTGTKSTLLSHPPVLTELQERRLNRAKERRYKRRRGCEVHCIGSQQRATQSKDEPQETPKIRKSPRPSVNQLREQSLLFDPTDTAPLILFFPRDSRCSVPLTIRPGRYRGGRV